MSDSIIKTKFDEIGGQFTYLLNAYPFTVVILFLILFILYFINRFTPVLRVSRTVGIIQGYLKTDDIHVDTLPISYWIKNDDKGGKYAPKAGKPFKDYHIMSSSKSYLVEKRNYDFCSLQVLESILLVGAKFIELDIYNAGFGEENHYPVVTNGHPVGEWKTCINTLSFEDCCNTILNVGIKNSNSTKPEADPIFLYLNCHVNKNLRTYAKMAEIIYRVFGEAHLLDIKHGNGCKNGPKIIDQSPENYYSRIIIVANIEDKQDKSVSPAFNEMVNIFDSPGDSQFESLSFTNFNNEDLNNITTKNKMIMTYDDTIGNDLVNYNSVISFTGGVQFPAMNFQDDDINMKQYLKMFSLDYPPLPGKPKQIYTVNTSYRLKK